MAVDGTTGEVTNDMEQFLRASEKAEQVAFDRQRKWDLRFLAMAEFEHEDGGGHRRR